MLAPNTLIYLPLYRKPGRTIRIVAKSRHNHKQRIIETLSWLVKKKSGGRSQKKEKFLSLTTDCGPLLSLIFIHLVVKG